MSHGEDNFVEALGQDRCLINGAGQQEICVSKKWICINCRKSCSWKREMRADVESGEDGWGVGGQRWAPIDTDPRRPNPRAPTAPTTQIWVDAPLAGVSFLRVLGIHLLSWLVDTDPRRPTLWSCLEKDIFWNYLKTNS